MSYDMEDDEPGFYTRKDAKNPYQHETSGGCCTPDCVACVWQRFGMSPHGHEMSAHEMKCADNCPACAWVAEKVEIMRREKVFAMKERLGYPTEVVTPTAQEHAWLRSYQISWEGDERAS